MSKALEDVVVVELTTTFGAAVAGALLADFGAQVIRIERVSAARAQVAPKPGDAGWDHEAELAHRNKTSLALDLDGDTGRGIVRELIAKADVLLTDWPRAALEQRGLDYASVCALKPEIIYARETGFGPKGPDRDLPVLDEIAAARTGMMPILPQPGQPPVYAGTGPMYVAVMIALGVTIALHHRQLTGEGQQVDASLFAGNMYGASLDLQAFLAMGGERFLQPASRLDAGNPMSGVLYPSSDGRWVCVTMPDTDRWWPGFSAMVGLDPGDPRFDTHEKRCGEFRLEMLRVLEEIFQRQPAAHWRREVTERQLSADIIEEFDYPANDPLTHRSRYILDLERPGGGRVKTLGFPLSMSETPGRLSRTAPCRGQHSSEILHDMLGYSEDRIDELQANGVVG
jgi:formyl-CoA transferase